jgi:hypothetical protein
VSACGRRTQRWPAERYAEWARPIINPPATSVDEGLEM